MNKKPDEGKDVGLRSIFTEHITVRVGPRPEYDSVQICLNGHLINLQAWTKYQFNKKYCPECGNRVISSCQKCEAPIKGQYLKDDIKNDATWIRPSYCENCGEPFPWTIKAVEAAKEVTYGLKLLSDEQKKEVDEDIDDMVRNTPRALVAAMRFKKTLEDAYGQIPQLYHDALLLAVTISIRLFLGW